MKVLISLVITTLALANSSEPPSLTCDSTQCLHEASNLMTSVDPSVDPCEDFHQFSCGNLYKNMDANDKLPLIVRYGEMLEKQVAQIYREGPRDEEHKMVKAVKRLYHACVAEKYIAHYNSIQTVKKALEAVGGWPLLEGSKWKEEDFHWTNATYKLTELGYDYSGFLEIDIKLDYNDGHIFEVYGGHLAESDRYVILQTAQMLGAHIDEDVEKQVTDLIDLREIGRFYPYYQPTVKEYQKQTQKINWLEFINTIVGPSAHISQEDRVVFPRPEEFTAWFHKLTATPKRTQANYLIWKAIEKLLPFFVDKSKGSQEGREEFCLSQIHRKFVPNPLQVIHARRYLPQEKRRSVEKLAHEFISGLKNTISQSDRITEEDKQKILEKLDSLQVVVGFPVDYWDDKILDDLDQDMIEVEHDNFLFELLAQANRNQKTTLYNRIKKLRHENIFDKQYIRQLGYSADYNHDYNLLYIPVAMTEELIFNEERPQYLNYPIFGNIFGSQLIEIVSSVLRKESAQTKAGLNQEGRCTNTYATEDNLEKEMMQLVVNQLSYEAYKNWTKTNGQEAKLIGLNYTPNQLFWIAGGSVWCFRTYWIVNWEQTYKLELQWISNATNIAIRNDPNFANDFNCPAGSPMNPSNKCQIF